MKIFKETLKLISFSLLAILFVLSFSTLNRVNASGNFPSWCTGATGIPADCSAPGEYEPDFNCINNKFLNPNLECCPNKCVGGSTSSPEDDTYQQINFFGTTVGLDFSNPNTIPTLVNLGISTFLGIISIYALFRGIYVAAFIRTSATDPARIAAINKELTNLVIGFIIAWGAIFIVQLVANIIGLGSLSNLQVAGTQGAYVITIQ